MDALCKRLRDRYEIAAITNDIYTKWDAEYLVRSGALAPERIAGVETGGCPHTAIREDASINLAAVAEMRGKFPDLDLVLIESGGDNLAATFSPELADLTIYVIDVAAGDKIPSKGGPGITRSDLLVINKIDLAPYVGASLEVMERDAKKMRGRGRSCSPICARARAWPRSRASSSRRAGSAPVDFAVLRVPMVFEIGNQRRAEMAIGLFAEIDREITQEQIDRLLRHPERPPVCDRGDHAGTGQPVDDAVER